MELVSTVCQFCKMAPFKYTCPNCNALYCSQDCYRSSLHKSCASSPYNIFDQSVTCSQTDRRDIMLRYLALTTLLGCDLEGPTKSESESSTDSDSLNILPYDDCFYGGECYSSGDDSYSYEDDDSFDEYDLSNDGNDNGDVINANGDEDSIEHKL